MRLTILGASPACQNRGGACSGYLLEQDGTTLLIDCGSGVFSRLQHHAAPESINAVIITHMHADHILDLLQYRYYLLFRALAGGPDRRPALYLPPGGHAQLLQISKNQDHAQDFFCGFFELQEYDPAAVLREGPFTVGFLPVEHIPHTYGVRVQGHGLFAFSADSGPCAALEEVAYGADLFLCECGNYEGSTYPFHLTPRQAGAIAAAAHVRRLLLTHRWWLHGQESAVAEARERYSGPIELAREDMQVSIVSPSDVVACVAS
jgi:ribonuclease BN (tRNA processing enzyme)